MAYKYKLKEQDKRSTLKPKDVPPSLLKRLEDLYGPVDTKNDFFSSDLDTYFKTTSIDKETGGVGHKPIPLASFEDSLRQVTMAYESLKDLLKSDEAKNDSNIQDVARDIKEALNKYRAHLRKFYPEQYRQAMSRIDEELDEISEEARLSRNKIRKHLRSEYPDEYKRMTMEGEIEEATGIDGDVIDLNPNNKTKLSNYVKLPHHLAAALIDIADEMIADEANTIGNQPQIKQALNLLKKAAEKAMTGEKEVEEMSTSSGAGSYLTKYAYKKPKKQEKLPEDIGATLGPGPKAGPDGVTDSAYTKQFKYKLVPKTKDGTYVQKGSGMTVKNLF